MPSRTASATGCGNGALKHGRTRIRCIRGSPVLDGRAPHGQPVGARGDAEAGRHVEPGANQLSEIRSLSTDRRDAVG